MAQLRADVREAVEGLMRTYAPPVPWDAYEFAKRRISEVCGWDAPADRYDQIQYDRAMRLLCDSWGL
jgi:hypothetical protein